MPRTEGVSSTSTVWRMRRRPRPATQALCEAMRWAGLRSNVTFTVLFAMTYPSISATDLPRLAAMSSGEAMLCKPFMVARTTLIGLLLPMHLARTL